MKSKRVAVILIAVVFAIVAICSVFATFTLRNVNAVFSVSEKNYDKMDGVQEKLDKALHQNLLFCNIEELKNEIEKDPYIEVTSIVKRYPDVLEIEVKDRKEIYVLEYENSYYVLSEDGIILNKSETKISGREYIELELVEIAITEMVVGNYIKTDDDRTMAKAFDVAKTARLTDCIKVMQVIKGAGNTVVGETIVLDTDIKFATYTAVDIEIQKIWDEGVLKTQKAFKAYTEETSDYRKSNNRIVALRVNGEIEVQFADNDV